MRDLDDETLAARAAARDERAWRELVRRFRGPLLCALGHLAPDRAEDLLGDLWRALIEDGARRLRAFRPERGTLRTYLRVVARNLARTSLRREGARAAAVQAAAHPPPEAPPQPLDLLLDRERAEVGLRLLGRLGPRDRELVRLHLVEGLRPRAVAARMGVAETTVYTKKHKIARRLARLAA